MPKTALNVAIGGKPDMGWCTAYVCFFDPKRTFVPPNITLLTYQLYLIY